MRLFLVRAARLLAVAALAASPAWLLFPTALAGRRGLGGPDLLYGHYLPWQASPPQGWRRPALPHTAAAVLRWDPYRTFTDRCLRQGTLPLWLPHVGFGEPFLGHSRTGPFFPLDPFPWLGEEETRKAWRAAWYLALAGLGAWVWLRALGLRRGPALFGVAACVWHGFHLAWLHHPHLRAAALLPLLLAAVEGLVRLPRADRAAALAGAVALVLLADHPETGGLVLLGGGGYGLARLGAGGPPLGPLRRRALALIWGGVAACVGAALGGVALLSLLTERGLPEAPALRLPLASLLGLWAANGWGTPGQGWWGPVYPTEAPPWVTAPVWAGALAGLGSWREARVRSLGVFLAAVLLAGWALPRLGGGHAGGTWPWHRALFLYPPALAALAAWRLERSLWGGAPLGKGALRLLGLVLLAGEVAFLAYFGASHADRPVRETWADGSLPTLLGRLAGSLVFAGLFLFLLTPRGARRQHLALAAALLLLLADGARSGRPWVAPGSPVPLSAPPLPLPKASGGPFAAQGHTLPPYLPLLWDAWDLRGSASRAVPWARTLLTRLLPEDPETRVTYASPGPLLRRLGLRYWLTPYGPGPESVLLAVGARGEPTAALPLTFPERLQALEVHTSLSGAWSLPQGAPVAQLTVHGARGETVALTLRAGVTTADAALRDHRDGRHASPPLAGTWTEWDRRGRPFRRQAYRARLVFPRALRPVKLTLAYRAAYGFLRLHRVRAPEAPPPFLVPPGFEPLGRAGPVTLYRDPAAWPVAFLTRRYRVGRTWRAVLSLLADPATGCVLAAPPARWVGVAAYEGPARPQPVPLRWTGPAAFEVALPARSRSTVLVLRVAYHPDWEAWESQGAPVPLSRVDGAFLGAVLDPGPAGTLRFRFLPAGFLYGSLLTAAGILAAAALWLGGRRAARRRATPGTQRSGE